MKKFELMELIRWDFLVKFPKQVDLSPFIFYIFQLKEDQLWDLQRWITQANRKIRALEVEAANNKEKGSYLWIVNPL